MTKFDSIESLYQILLVRMLQIWNLRYLKHYWIIKYVSLESIIFTINIDDTSSSKVFSTLDYIFPLIILLF